MAPNTFHPDLSGEPLEAESLYLPASLGSVRLARRLVTDSLSAWELEDLVFPCTQVVAELAANSVAEVDSKDASEGFSVHLCLTATHLLLKVSDTSSQPPKPRSAAEEDESGRGLVLVEALADHWGWYTTAPTEKIVYAAWKLPAVLETPCSMEAVR